jgi:hypothetical protein
MYSRCAKYVTISSHWWKYVFMLPVYPRCMWVSIMRDVMWGSSNVAFGMIRILSNSSYLWWSMRVPLRAWTPFWGWVHSLIGSIVSPTVGTESGKLMTPEEDTDASENTGPDPECKAQIAKSRQGKDDLTRLSLLRNSVRVMMEQTNSE